MDSHSTQGFKRKNYLLTLAVFIVLVVISLLIFNYFGLINLSSQINPQKNNLPPQPPQITSADIDKQLMAFNPTKTTVAGVGTSYLFQGTIRSIRHLTQPASGSAIELTSVKGENIPLDLFLRDDNENIVTVTKGKEASSSAEQLKVGTFVNIYYYLKDKSNSGTITKIVVGAPS